MSKYFLVAFCLATALINGVQSQCPEITPVTPAKDIPVFDRKDNWEATIEQSTQKPGSTITENYLEYYDGEDNLGISGSLFNGNMANLQYLSYATKQFLDVDATAKSCKVYNLDDSADFESVNELSRFPLVDPVEGDEHQLLSPLSVIVNNPEYKFVYTGDSVVRGILANTWRACAYDKFKMETLDITLSFNDETKWRPAHVDLKSNNSVPVEVRISTKKSTEDVAELNVYAIHNFVQNAKEQIEYLSTPDGVYCPGRKSDPNAKLPAIPNVFSFQVQEINNQFPTTNVLIREFYEEYNGPDKLFAFYYDRNNSYTEEIHDFNTGLKYTINENGNKCQIDKLNVTTDGIDTEIDTNGNILMRDPQNFFNIDPEKFQFAGFKKRDGVDVQTWIGPKTVNGFDVLFEWHYLANFVQNGNQNRYQVPIRMNTYYNLANVTEIEVKEYHLFNYRTDYSIHLNDFNLRACENTLANQVYSFSLPKDNVLATKVKYSKDHFRQGVIRYLAEAGKVTILRISHVEVSIQSQTVYVLFTLYEKSRFYGQVPVPEFDERSNVAVSNIAAAFAAGEKKIEFWNNKENVIESAQPVSSSFKKQDSYEIVYSIKKTGFNGGTLSFLSLFALVVGAALMIVVIVLEKKGTIQIMKPLYS